MRSVRIPHVLNIKCLGTVKGHPMLAGMRLLVAATVITIGNAANACSPFGLIGEKWNQLKPALGNCIND